MFSLLTEYYQKWSLQPVECIAETHSSIIHKVKMQDGGLAVLKVLNEEGRIYEGRGASVLEYYNGCGAVEVYKFDDGASLLEYADGQELTSLVVNGRDEQATHIICDVVAQLHT